MALNLARDIVDADLAFRKGEELWGGDGNQTARLLSGADVGIIGFGDLGRALNRLLTGFRVSTKVFDPWLPPSILIDNGVEPASLDEVLTSSDFVFVVASVTSENQGFLGAEAFASMEGFGVHTFRLLNAKDESTFVKFLWKPKLGLQSVAWNEAVKINGADPDFHRRDLWDAIHAGNFPEWELQLQLFDQAFADSFDFDILDPTKIIPEEVLPPIAVGRLVLDRMRPTIR